MAGQRPRQRLGRAAGITQTHSRRSQGEPDFAHILPGGERSQQPLGAGIIATDAGFGERQAQGRIGRQQPMRPVEPEQTLEQVGGGSASLERSSRQPDAVGGVILAHSLAAGGLRSGFRLTTPLGIRRLVFRGDGRGR